MELWWKRSVLYLIALFSLFLRELVDKNLVKIIRVKLREWSIVTSFYPVYAMVKEISGDLNDVRWFRSSFQVFIPLSPLQMILQPLHADVFVYHSHTLESWPVRSKFAKSKVKVLEASEGMTWSALIREEAAGEWREDLVRSSHLADPEKVAEEDR